MNFHHHNCFEAVHPGMQRLTQTEKDLFKKKKKMPMLAAKFARRAKATEEPKTNVAENVRLSSLSSQNLARNERFPFLYSVSHLNFFFFL